MPTAGHTQIALSEHNHDNEGSDGAYSDDDKGEEESKVFEDRKAHITNVGFDGSDNEAYQESDDDNDVDEYDITSVDSEERNKAFYGDEYTLISQPDEQHLMSMTM